MHSALIATCCALAGIQPPLAQDWSDTSLIRADDDWSGVRGMVGYRGDGLVAEPGADPRDVVADGSGTPIDVTANQTTPGSVGLAAGLAEFELPNPVVALRGSATASAPHALIALDTRGRTGIAIRLTLRDIDDTADAVEPIAVQYRVGGSGDFANAPGGYVADATSAASVEKVTPVRVLLPPAADDRALVEVRALTTDSAGRDEWVGVDDIEVAAATVTRPACRAPLPAPVAAPPPVPPSQPASHRFRLSGPAGARLLVARDGRRLRLRIRGRRGLIRLRFSGRVRGRPLSPGAYSISGIASPQG